MTWSVANYNANPDLNTAINGTDIAELCSPAGYNNALRQIMADIAAWTAAHAFTPPASIAQGGTGQTSAPAALAALGGLSSIYQHLPQVAKSTAFALDLTMDGGHVYYNGGAAAATINPDSTTAFATGAVVVIVNDGSGALTLTRGTGVSLVWPTNGLDDNRVLAVRGMATMLKVAANRWYITGSGLS